LSAAAIVVVYCNSQKEQEEESALLVVATTILKKKIIFLLLRLRLNLSVFNSGFSLLSLLSLARYWLRACVHASIGDDSRARKVAAARMAGGRKGGGENLKAKGARMEVRRRKQRRECGKVTATGS
jgi:hypothetical protein